MTNIEENRQKQLQEELVTETDKPLKAHHIYILIILILTIGIYFISLFNNFVYDDTFTITRNQLIRDWINLPEIFSKSYFSRSGEATYRPIVTLTYFLDYALWGLNPFGYHLTNILIHSANAVLVYFFTNSLLKHNTTAFLTAILFAIHPVQAEAVNAVSFREDLLVVLFLLPAFLIFLKLYNGTAQTTIFKELSFATFLSINFQKKCLLYLISLLLYLLALLSKEMAVTFPLLLIGYKICFEPENRAQGRQRTFRYLLLGYSIITLIYLVIYLGPLRNPGKTDFTTQDMLIRLLTIPEILLNYLYLIIIPWKLTAHHVISFTRSLLEPSFWISTTFLTGIGIAIIKTGGRNHRKKLFGFWWFFAGLIPVMNIVPIDNAMAERYLYLPFIGIALLFSNWVIYNPDIINGIDKDRGSWFCFVLQSKRVIKTVVLFLLFLYGTRTVLRNTDWQDSFRLWSKTIVVSPDSARAHYNLGNANASLGRYQAAIKEYKKSIHIRPDHPKAHNNLGNSYGAVGRWQDALKEYKIDINLHPTDPELYSNIGYAYSNLGSLHEAIKAFRTALRIKSDLPDTHYNLGLMYTRIGRWQDAIQEWNTTLSIAPNHQPAQKGLQFISKRGKSGVRD